MSLLLNIDDFVRITNTSSELIVGRYDGKDYEFPPPARDGEHVEYFPQDVHKVVARHVFGWLDPKLTYTEKDAQEIRERAFLRLGWVSGEPDKTLTKAFVRLREIRIEPVPPFPNVRVLRPDSEYKMPKFEVIPVDETESAPPVAPGKQVSEAGEAHASPAEGSPIAFGSAARGKKA